MGIFSWLFSKATSGVIETAGEAITKVVRVTKGDKAAVQEHVHDEQMAVLAAQASEFVSRPTRTVWDSLVDGLNRLPRPILVLWVFGLMIWPAIDLGSFVRYMTSLSYVPDEIWTLFLAIVAFFFGSRIISQDIRKPRLSPEQRDKALKTIKEREKVITDARVPLVVPQAPTRKPPVPPSFKPEPAPVVPPIKLPDLPADTSTKAAVDVMIDGIIRREGGYVNHPSDRGGPTNMGITLATLAAWREETVTEDDVKALKASEAADIYRAQYYIAPGIDTLPVSVQAHVMDIAVNAGPRAAVKILQRALNGLGEQISIDGVIGDETRGACGRYDARKINNAIVEVRLRFYNDIVSNNPTQSVFLAGWQKRAKGFLVA